MSLVICTPGTAAAPSIEFGATNTGFYLDSNGYIACTIDGVANELIFTELWLRIPNATDSGTPASGTLIYDTGSDKLMYYDDAGWETISSS